MMIKGIYSKQINKITQDIINLEEEYSKLTDKDLKMKTIDLKNRFKNGETLDELLVEAFATIREVSFRTLGMKQFETQIMGGIVLHQGRVVEMATGEGKTLTEIAPAYLNALSEKSVYIATVNNYLAKRDMEEMKEVFNFLGMNVGLVIDESGVDKALQYKADIIYTTNSEVGFDYLRDNMVYQKKSKKQRDRSFLILDEIDSILIDDSMTPLLISAKGDDIKEDLYKMDVIIKSMNLDDDFELDLKSQRISILPNGIKKIEGNFNLNNLADEKSHNLILHMNNALRANYLLENGKDYLVENKKLILIDKSTGRRADGRRFSDGLHCALEAKEKLEINSDDHTIASITYKNLFELYDKVSGMSGTVYTEKEELQDFYNLDVVVIPRNKEIKRIDYEDRVFKNERSKLHAVIIEVEKIHKIGRPILIGAPSVSISEKISELLNNKGINHTLLNAINIKEEAEIIKRAGEFRAITVATNVAGRGTDIKIEKAVNQLGGLAVIATGRAFSKRVDNQLKGRAGRQGDNGSSQFFVSFEDEIFKQAYGIDFKKKLAKISRGELDNRKYFKKIDKVQSMLESQMYSSRKYMIELGNILWLQQKAIYGMRDKILNSESVFEYINEIIKNRVSEITKKLNEYNFEKNDTGKALEILKEIRYIVVDEFNLLIKELNINLQDMLNVESIDELNNFLVYSIINRLQYCSLTCDMDYKLKQILLAAIDISWEKHLLFMDLLKKSSEYSKFKQVNSEITYGLEGNKAFKSLIAEINKLFVKEAFLIEIGVPSNN